MGKDWKESLASFFEDLVIIRHSQQEAREQLGQFCEFIAEPAFEELGEELKNYRISSRIKKSGGKWISFQINFPKSRIENIQYMIFLPHNQLELRLRLRLRGRATKRSLLETREQEFMEGVPPEDILKLKKEDVIQDVIEHYRRFNFEAAIRPD